MHASLRLSIAAALVCAGCGDDGSLAEDMGSLDDASPVDGFGEPADSGPEPADSGAAEDAATDERIDVVVAFGWQGLRSLSMDEGLTWCETGLMAHDHDDLFRGGTFAEGLFVGAHAGRENRGAILVSRNGYEWTALHRTNFEPDLPENPSGQWYGGVAYGNGTWLAAGGCGQLARSSDGREWTALERFTEGCLHIRSLAFGDGRFVAGLDDDTWWESADGDDWMESDLGSGSTVIWNGTTFEGEVDGRRLWRGRGLCMYGEGWADDARIMRSENADCSDAVEVAHPAHSVTTIAYGDAPAADFEPGTVPAKLATCLGL